MLIKMLMKEVARRQGLTHLSGTMPSERTVSLLKFLGPVSKCMVSFFCSLEAHRAQDVD